MYGFEIDWTLSDLSTSFKSLDKYLVPFESAFEKYIKKQLCSANCCLIYDQFLQLPEEAFF